MSEPSVEAKPVTELETKPEEEKKLVGEKTSPTEPEVGTQPIVEEPEEKKPAEEATVPAPAPTTTTTTTISPEPAPIPTTVSITQVPADSVNITKNYDKIETTEKKVDTVENLTHTEETKTTEEKREIVVNEESVKLDVKTAEKVETEKKIEPETHEEKSIVKKTTRGRASRTVKSSGATSTEIIQVEEIKNPVETTTKQIEVNKEEKEEIKPVVETPKRGRGRQPKRKAEETPKIEEEVKKPKLEETPPSVKKTPARKPAAKRAKKQDSDSETAEKKEAKTEEKSESEEESEGEVPLLEQSLTVEGKRQRKLTQRLELNIKEAPKTTYSPQGKGTKLGEIPRICYFIEKTTSDNLRLLYRICINSHIKKLEIKKNLKLFNGYPFERDSPELEKKRDMLLRITVQGLKCLCELLDLKEAGTKEELMERILDFLLDPKDSGRPVPQHKSKQKTAKKTAKKSSKSEEEEIESEKESDKSIVKQEEEEEEEQKQVTEKQEESMEVDKTKSESEVESEPEPEPEVKKTRGRKSKASKKPTRKTVAKRGAKAKTESEDQNNGQEEQVEKNEEKKEEPKSPVKQNGTTEEKESKKEEEEEEEKASNNHENGLVIEENNDKKEESESQKESQNPSEEDLRKTIKEIIDNANLDKITMKKVIQDVNSKYPNHNLNDQKNFIKQTVKELLES